ncbi:MAG: putative lipid II flippase FtsW [Gammaproteobacteria bacterium]|nr:putative lipid II flippase FtsW [Gammaproteobacteria bacterium]
MSGRRSQIQATAAPMVDVGLVVIIGLLLGAGLIVLASASIALADRNTGAPLFYLERQAVAALFGIAIGVGVFRLPTDIWERAGLMLPCLAIVLMATVLVPGLGHTVNGSTRWLRVAGVTVQVAEPARLLLLMYLAGYAVRHGDELRRSLTGFLKPMVLVAVCCALLLAQPDFGSAVVLVGISLALLFAGGARLRDLLGFTALFVAAGVGLALASPYRLARITGFMDPWADPYGSGFQLIQSLIAIGSGEWLGAGLGAGVQKLFYLPEAHTDFVFAVFAEEFGLLGSLLLILLFGLLVWRALCIAQSAAQLGRFYQANLAFGFAVWQGMQVFINIGVNMGVLPTKGLTLPLISYGRSSLIITLIGLALLLRVDHENRLAALRPARTGRRRRRS